MRGSARASFLAHTVAFPRRQPEPRPFTDWMSRNDDAP